MNERDYESPEYKAFRFAVMIRDNWTCQICSSKKDLEAHHIKRWADAPALRFVSSNGITLCTGCHKTVTGREEEYEEQFKRIINVKKFEKGGVVRKRSESATKAKRNFHKYKWRPQDPNLRY